MKKINNKQIFKRSGNMVPNWYYSGAIFLYRKDKRGRLMYYIINRDSSIITRISKEEIPTDLLKRAQAGKGRVIKIKLN